MRIDYLLIGLCLGFHHCRVVLGRGYGIGEGASALGRVATWQEGGGPLDRRVTAMQSSSILLSCLACIGNLALNLIHMLTVKECVKFRSASIQITSSLFSSSTTQGIESVEHVQRKREKLPFESVLHLIY
jgi:hypothetical protein